MKQVVQHVRKGDVQVVDVPPPAVRPGHLLVRVSHSVISVGTERHSVAERKQSLVTRALKNPDVVARVVDQVRSQGVASVYGRIKGRLDAYVPMGYSLTGTVEEAGDDTPGFSVGDRVACAGAGLANHAEIVVVPKNLCTLVPDGVDPEAAAYTTVGAIALQGVRQADVSLGETVAVLGLGLVGQLTLQLLKAAGCRVVGFDPDKTATGRARSSGADAVSTRPAEVVRLLTRLTGGVGADAVVITAATPSDDPVALAGELARDRGRVVLVGDVGLRLPRGPYYMKELDFRLSRSYGPGRYDATYEEDGVDYPVGYVRWTEQRNMAEVLRLMSVGAIDPTGLTTHRFMVDEAPKAFALLSGRRVRSAGRPFGVVLSYPEGATLRPAGRTVSGRASRRPAAGEPLAIGFVGAGSFAQSTLLPALKAADGVTLEAVCTGSGVSAENVRAQYGFAHATTDLNDLLSRAKIGTVFIASRHHLHAEQLLAAVRAAKNVFIEKPLVMREQELAAVERELLGPRPPSVKVMVGFNRRFAPSVRALKETFAAVLPPYTLHYRVHAGLLPRDHWTLHPEKGGGRIVGEVCHFIDTIAYLTSSHVARVTAERVGQDGPGMIDDSVVISLRMANGSVATIHYLANGDSGVPKERIDMSGGGRTAELDNFRILTTYLDGRRSERAWHTLDKGHREEVRQFLHAVSGDAEPPISLADAVHATRTTFAVQEALRRATPVVLL